MQKYSTVYYSGLTVKNAHYGRVRRSVSRDWQSARAHNTLDNTGLPGKTVILIENMVELTKKTVEFNSM